MKQLQALLNIWWVGTLAIALLFIVQTMGGVFGRHVGSAWIWLLITCGPMIGLLYFYKFSGKEVFINKTSFNIIRIVSILFLLGALCILVLKPALGPNISANTYLNRTRMILLVPQLFLFFYTFLYLRNPRQQPLTPYGKEQEKAQRTKPLVFISYSHSNRDEAQAVKDHLEANDIDVLIDERVLQAGGNIRDFIIDCIKESDATLSIVSTKALMSSWVGMESILTFQAKIFDEDKLFLPVMLDTEFFGISFIGDKTEELLKKSEEIQAEIDRMEKLARQADLSTMAQEKARYDKLINNLPGIIAHLKNHLTIDITGDAFQPGMESVTDKIKQHWDDRRV